MTLRDDLVAALSLASGFTVSEVTLMLSVPPDPTMGDFAFPCFKLQMLSKNPCEAAELLKMKLELPTGFERAEVKGPYLNFFVLQSSLTSSVLGDILRLRDEYGKGFTRRNIVVEYCGPNTNKPLHLGHMRNMALGNSMVRLLEFQGNVVHPVNIINDRGVHICQSMLAYMKWGNSAKPSKKGDHYVGDFYVMFAQAVKEEMAQEEMAQKKVAQKTATHEKVTGENAAHEGATVKIGSKNGSSMVGCAVVDKVAPPLKILTLKDEAQSLLVKWEQNDPATRAVWRVMNDWVLSGFAETYARFGVSFEREYFESEYYEFGRDVALKGFEEGIFEKDAKGGIVANLERYGIPSKVVLRSDGTSIYITQDMCLALKRYEDYHFDSLVYVVACEQQMHFQQLFAIMDLLKQPFAPKLYHLSYGLVNLPTGRMKSREGTVVDADDLMDEVSNLAYVEVEKRSPALGADEIRRRAEFIAIGAIRFLLIRCDPVKEIIFNPEESINFEGETGPYLQYTHARACSILRKASVDFSSKVHVERLSSDSEKQLVLLLSRFSDAVSDAAKNYRPHVLCRYLLDLAQAFNEFYHSSLVISSDFELMRARALLVFGVREVLSSGLYCLGIYAPEEM